MSNFRRRRGCQLVILAGLIGAAAAAYDYSAVWTGIDHSEGVLLVLVSGLLLVFGALVVFLFNVRVIATIFMVLVFLDILGTDLAAYMLESGLIMAAMVMAAAGWVLMAANGVQGGAS